MAPHVLAAAFALSFPDPETLTMWFNIFAGCYLFILAALVFLLPVWCVWQMYIKNN